MAEEFKRKLATIQRISELNAIPKADRIQVAMMEGLGWECVVKKDEVKVGDLVVYFEVDSILPETDEYEFLRSRKFRIKIIKLKKQVSNGLILPVNILPKDVKLKVGTDVTDVLGVVKYDPQKVEEGKLKKMPRSKVLKYLMRYGFIRNAYIKMNTVSKGWPTWIVHTDEERIQNCAKVVINNYNKDWYITEKLDGQSATFFAHKIRKWGLPSWEFGVCSRNIRLKKPDSSNYWKIAKKCGLEAKLKGMKRNIVVQGEIIGTGIQKNKYNVDGLEFYVYNVLENGVQYSLEKMLKFCLDMELCVVPVLNDAYLFKSMGNPLDSEVKDIVHHFVHLSESMSLKADIQREGIVVRLNENPRISFKAINPKFSLKYES